MPHPGSNYWSVLFTPETWAEAGRIDFSLVGFRESREAFARTIRPGDLLLSYLTGKSRYIAVLKATSEPFVDNETRVWASDQYPIRVRTQLVCKTGEDEGVHLHEVVAQSERPQSWGGYYRASPQRLPRGDGRYIEEQLRLRAESNALAPSDPPVDLSVGGDEPDSPDSETAVAEPSVEREHDRIQHRLLTLGRELGFDVWVARNDQSRTVAGQRFGDLSVEKLPIFGFDETTRRTVELIDVLWIDGNRIEAAFEIEKSTRIFSGLLRMADLVAMQPNVDVPLFIVAPDDRRAEVFREIRRPVFSNLRPPLAKACRYISFRRLEDELDALGSRTRHLRPSFLSDIAERAI